MICQQPRTLTVKNLPVPDLQRCFFSALRHVGCSLTYPVTLGFLRVSEISLLFPLLGIIGGGILLFCLLSVLVQLFGFPCIVTR